MNYFIFANNNILSLEKSVLDWRLLRSVEREKVSYKCYETIQIWHETLWISHYTPKESYRTYMVSKNLYETFFCPTDIKKDSVKNRFF